MIARKLEVAELPLKGAFTVQPLEFRDGRGTFYKMYDEELLSGMGVKPYFAEEYLSVSREGVLRGLHYQSGSHAQAKLVRCSRGSVFDVIVDLRKSSETYGKWHGAELSEQNALSLYVPRGFAHGFLALSEGACLNYKADNHYSPEHECGIHYADKALGISWPLKREPILSGKDLGWPSFGDCVKFE